MGTCRYIRILGRAIQNVVLGIHGKVLQVQVFLPKHTSPPTIYWRWGSWILLAHLWTRQEMRQLARVLLVGMMLALVDDHLTDGLGMVDFLTAAKLDKKEKK